MDAGGYGRISSSGQKDGTSLDTQELAWLAEAEKLGYVVAPEHVWREVWTGADLERPALSQVRAAARAGAIDALFVYSPDRLSRDPLHLLMLMKELGECGVQLYFVQGVSDDTPEGQLLAYIQGYTAQKERAQLTERTLRGKNAVARSGRMPNGTGAGLFGYDYDVATKKRTINEKEATAVELMFRWAASGVAVYQIALRLNRMGIPTKKGCKWHAISVRRLLVNPAFTGVQTYGKNRYTKVSEKKRVVTPRPPEEVIILEGFTPAIISKELFDLVQECLAVRQARHNPNYHSYLLTGFTKCFECGSAVVGGAMMKSRRYYRCRATVPTQAGMPATCKARYVLADVLEEAVWSEVCGLLKNPAVLVAELRSHFETGDGDLGQAMKDLKKDILELKGQQRRLIELRQKDMIDLELLESQIGPLKSLCDEKEHDLRLLEQQRQGRDDEAEMGRRIAALCQQFADKLDGIDFEEKRSTLGAFWVKVRANKENLSITMVVDPKVATTERTLACSTGSLYSFVFAELEEVVVQKSRRRVVEWVKR